MRLSDISHRGISNKDNGRFVNRKDNISNHNKRDSIRFNKPKVRSNVSNSKHILGVCNVRGNQNTVSLEKNLMDGMKENDGRRTEIGNPYSCSLRPEE